MSITCPCPCSITEDHPAKPSLQTRAPPYLNPPPPGKRSEPASSSPAISENSACHLRWRWMRGPMVSFFRCKGPTENLRGLRPRDLRDPYFEKHFRDSPTAPSTSCVGIGMRDAGAWSRQVASRNSAASPPWLTDSPQ